MARQPEALLIDRIRKALEAEWPNLWTMKVAGGGYQRAGIPDLLCCLQGRLVTLEAKCPRPGESVEHARDRVTDRQAAEMNRLWRAGAAVAVVTSVEEAVMVLRRAERRII